MSRALAITPRMPGLSAPSPNRLMAELCHMASKLLKSLYVSPVQVAAIGSSLPCNVVSSPERAEDTPRTYGPALSSSTGTPRLALSTSGTGYLSLFSGGRSEVQGRKLACDFLDLLVVDDLHLDVGIVD